MCECVFDQYGLPEFPPLDFPQLVAVGDNMLEKVFGFQWTFATTIVLFLCSLGCKNVQRSMVWNVSENTHTLF